MDTGIDCVGVSTSFYCHNGNGKWLLHKRSENCRDEKGAWDSGGGKLEFGLTLEQNVLKEVREEYGCEATIQKQLPAITLLRQSPEGKETHWVVIPFILFINMKHGKEVKMEDSEKMVELSWFSLDKLPKPLHSGFQKTFQLNKSTFRKYSST